MLFIRTRISRSKNHHRVARDDVSWCRFHCCNLWLYVLYEQSLVILAIFSRACMLWWRNVAGYYSHKNLCVIGSTTILFNKCAKPFRTLSKRTFSFSSWWIVYSCFPCFLSLCWTPLDESFECHTSTILDTLQIKFDRFPVKWTHVPRYYDVVHPFYYFSVPCFREHFAILRVIYFAHLNTHTKSLFSTAECIAFRLIVAWGDYKRKALHKIPTRSWIIQYDSLGRPF